MVAAHLDMPFGFDARNRAAVTGDDDHIRDMIKAVLFTAPGERVNRPEFGCGLKTLVFAPLSDTLVATTQHMVQASLLRWLGEIILVDGVEVRRDDSQLLITISYSVRATAERRVAQFQKAVPA
nr:GPW/gp25 family protein [Polymorphobacter sp.]